MREVRRFAAAVVAGVLSMAGSGLAFADEPAAITADEAVDTFQGSAPAVLAPAIPTIIDSQGFSPSLVPDDATFRISGSNALGVVYRDPNLGFAVGRLRATPVAAGVEATPPRLVGDDVAVFANTAEAADTAIRPTAAGVETFTQVRDASAPETYSWRIALEDDQRLERLADGSVAVVETGVDETAAPAEGSGADPLSERAITDSVTQLTDAKAQVADAERATTGEVVGYVSTPVARDADGDPVASSLSVAGDVVHLHVAHRLGAAYPVQVDPTWWGGANVYSGYGPTYQTGAVKDVLLRLRERDRVEYAVLVPQLFQTNAEQSSADAFEALRSSTIRYVDGTKNCEPNSVETAYNDGVEEAARYARSELGMTVVIKPHIDVVYRHPDGYYKSIASRTEIQASTSNFAAWWSNYRCKMVKYANLAARAGADYLLIGTELDLMTDNDEDSAQMSGLITDIRARHPLLKLGYAANWDATVPSQVDDLATYFFNQLDLIGVDAYFRKGVDTVNPWKTTLQGGTPSEIAAAWGSKAMPGEPRPGGGTFTCPARIDTALRPLEPNQDHPGVAIQCLRNQYGKDVILSELGYPENKADGLRGAYDFWKNWVKEYPGQRCWFKGIWPWMAGAGGASGNDFNIIGTQAEDVMANNQFGPSSC